jgi:predicted aminopeptidase
MLTCLFCHDIIVYGTSQGIGQVKLVMNAKPIEEVLKDPAFPDSLKYKLVLITEIKKFAVDSLGINPSDNYSTVYDQKGKPVLWTISASEPYALIAKEWTFPFLGTVSYKGFFNREPLLKEKLELVKSNYDIDIYSPAGWSTLGWFRDPILSNMLLKEEGDLANLIIHELTHGTLFVKDSVTFNENLASFIGDKGAEIFLLNYFGKNSKEYLNYEFHKADELIYNEYILKSTARLDSLYNLMGKGNTEASTKAKKKELITEIALGVNRLHLHNKKRFFKYTLQAFKEGNAFFMAFSRYDSQQDLFEKEYKEKYHSDLKQYLEAMKEKYPSL